MNDFVRWVKEVEFLMKWRSSVTNKDQEDNKKLLHRERSGERDRERERERRAPLNNWTRGWYWGMRSVHTATTEGHHSQVRSRASEVIEKFIIWHPFAYETTLSVVHSNEFPAWSQGKKPAILSGFGISLMIVAVDRQKLPWLLNENCCSCIIRVSFFLSGADLKRARAAGR